MHRPPMILSFSLVAVFGAAIACGSGREFTSAKSTGVEAGSTDAGGPAGSAAGVAGGSSSSAGAPVGGQTGSGGEVGAGGLGTGGSTAAGGHDGGGGAAGGAAAGGSPADGGTAAGGAAMGGFSAGGGPGGTGGQGSAACLNGTCAGRCSGKTCGGEWTCNTEIQICTADIAEYCGCDGATFADSSSCPGRAFAHRGACEKPGSKVCGSATVTCRRLQPECGALRYPEVINGCWGSCVPVESCGCKTNDDCPDPKNTDETVCTKGVCGPQLR